MGYNSIANGPYSTAMGFESIANGKYSNAIGYSSISNGQYSSSMGYYSMLALVHLLLLGNLMIPLLVQAEFHG
ncbi:MAG: hypothetical protein IPL95_03930 [Saprospiraceae bacterium]|nr:hypothetical protein [Saprospiraceae bacterium]